MAAGRVISYTGQPGTQLAEVRRGRVRQELPADARVLWRHTLRDICAQEQFSSAALAAAPDDGQVSRHYLRRCASGPSGRRAADALSPEGTGPQAIRQAHEQARP